MKTRPRTEISVMGFFISSQVWPWRAYLVGNKQFQSPTAPESLEEVILSDWRGGDFNLSLSHANRGEGFIFRPSNPAFGAMLRVVQRIVDGLAHLFVGENLVVERLNDIGQILTGNANVQ